jgi:hypothetical protein
MRSFSTLALLVTAIASATTAGAQSTLSGQGFGYPAGQISTRSLGAGGATSEFDPYSVTNPATITHLGTSVLYVQVEPEYRTLTVGSSTEKSMIARHPLVVAAVPITSTLFGGISLSNLLDRSFETSTRGTQRIGDSSLATTNSFRSDGAIADVRLSLGWMPASWIRIGVGAHAITGDNRLQNVQVFDDSARFSRLVDTSTVTYLGSALSTGVELVAGGVVSVSGSYRRGGSLRIKHGDTLLTRANAPDRMAFSAAFLGFRGSTLAVRAAKDTWSRMRGLGNAALPISDGWDTSVGADVLGPRFGERVVQLRAGGRWRTLPFGLASSEIREKSLALGAGTQFGRGRVGLDFAAIRSMRDPVSSTIGIRESAWTMSFGVLVRP